MKIIILGALVSFASLTAHAQDDEYPMTDICRATLNDMLKRDISTMNSTLLADGSARVKYTRPQDGQKFSYRCRSVDGHIGILDESLTGPRWYGELPEDIQRMYVVKDNSLIIRSIYRGDVSETFFSHADFSNKPENYKDETPVLTQYGTSIAKTFGNGKVKLTKAYHVVSKPLNTYRIDFDTSSKRLLTQPGAEDDNAIFDENTKKTETWEAAFCTNDLKKIMTEKGMDMVTGVLLNNGQTHSIAPCFK
ncbi:hypothetical protein [Pantoea sp. MBLJ3]|jgi:hypothetical protein|uniref:hypothetical protein n=1 Tax=Pantoea sp. MBLJ3 TaxID=1562889 RepID=UPI0005806622|nr:hypothetical protein [Pantoea sp. MBLJ3]